MGSAIGAALLALGTGCGGTLAIIGAGSHLWSDDAFLASFAFSGLLLVVGLYVLYAEFISPLPLPATRRERAERRWRAQLKPASTEGVSSSAATEAAPRRVSATRATTSHRKVTEPERSRDRVFRDANELLREILEAELEAKNTPAGLNERLYYNLEARVEAWAHDINCFDEVQKFSGNVVADLPRLKVFVQTHLERWRDEQGTPA